MAILKRVVAASMALAVGGLLAGPEGSLAAAKPVTVMLWATQKADTDAFTRLAKEFMKSSGGVPVKLIIEPWAGELPYFQKYLAMATAGVAPDILMVPFPWIPNFAEANLLEDITPWAKRSKLKLAEWTDAGIESSSWGGKLWGLSGGASSDWWIQFNKRVIAESGALDPGTLFDQGNWNWDSMEAIMQKTSRFDGNRCVRIGLNQMGVAMALAPWVWGMGGQIISADGTQCLLGEQPAVDAMNKVRNYVFNKKIMGMAWFNYGLDHLKSAQKSQFAMSAWWSTFGTFLASQKVPWEVDMVPFPAGPKSAKTVMTIYHSWVISKQSRRKDAAWAVLQFFGGSRGQEIMLDDLQGLPTRKDIIPKVADAYRKAGMLSAARGVQDAMSRQRIWERSPKMHLALPIMDAAVGKLWEGNADVAMTLKAGAKAATIELSRGVKRK